MVHEVQLAYNEFGQVVTSWQAHGGAVNTSTSPKVQYDYADGSAGTIRPTGLVYPDGREIGYDYGSSNGVDDAASRVRDLEDGGSFLLRYDYLGLGTPVEVTYPFHDINLPGGGGYTRLMQYTLVGTSSSSDPDTGDQYKGLDRFGRVKDSRWVRYHNGTPADLDRIKYGYDRASNRIWRENPVATGFSQEFDELYAHDGLHRLKHSARGTLDSGHSTLNSQTFAQCWTLDATGNWKGFRQDDDGDGTWELAQQRTANAVNEITGVTETAGPSWATPGYDAAGNMTAVPKPADPTASYTATYDAWNRLVRLEEEVSGSSSSSSGGGGLQTVQENQYDARRYRTVRKDYVSGVLDETRHFYYTEQWQSVEERVGSSSTAERQHIWGLRYIDDLVLRERDTDGNGTLDESLYALQDANWNVTAVASGLYDVEERYAYTAYGEPVVLDDGFEALSGSSYACDVLYAGYRWDVTTGLQPVRYRTFCAAIGSWLQRDRVQFSFILNLYQYALGRALLHLDPFGLQSAAEHHGMPFYLGGGLDQPTVDFLLTPGIPRDKLAEAHVASQNYLRESYPYGEAGREAWSKLTPQQRMDEVSTGISKGLEKLGADPETAKKMADDIVGDVCKGMDLTDAVKSTTRPPESAWGDCLRPNVQEGTWERIPRSAMNQQKLAAAAARRAAEAAQAAGQTAARSGSRFGRFCKKAAGLAPGPLGLLVSAFFFPDKVQAKGLEDALFDEGLDQVPGLDLLKGGSELATGRDWVPARGEKSLFHEAGECLAPLGVGPGGRRWR